MEIEKYVTSEKPKTTLKKIVINCDRPNKMNALHELFMKISLNKKMSVDEAHSFLTSRRFIKPRTTIRALLTEDILIQKNGFYYYNEPVKNGVKIEAVHFVCPSPKPTNEEVIEQLATKKIGFEDIKNIHFIKNDLIQKLDESYAKLPVFERKEAIIKHLEELGLKSYYEETDRYGQKKKTIKIGGAKDSVEDYFKKLKK